MSTRLLGPDGWVPIDQVARGQLLLGHTGGQLTVLSARSRTLPVYNVMITGGVTAMVGGEQMWHVQSHSVRETAKRTGLPQWHARSTQDLAATLTAGVTRATYLPICTPPCFTDPAPLPIDPYALGLLLGDGSFRGGTPRFTKPEPELHDALAHALPGIRLAHLGDPSKGEVSLRSAGGPNPLTAALRDLELFGRASWEKHVPSLYLKAEPGDRLALLQGMADTDGWVQRNSIGNTACEIGTSSPQLARGLAEIAQSLGGTCTLRCKPEPRYQNGIGRSAYIVRMNLPRELEPFRLTRKLDAWQSGRTSKATGPVRKIERIELAGTACCRIIEVEGRADHVVLDQYVVT